ncbi:MAG: MATE family efflux transporter [Lachnospiraceae bacterium]
METKTGMKENKMGVMPIHKLLISMSLPMMISMLVLGLYNIVDSVFVAMISEEALTAVSLAYPVQLLAIALGGGTCVGVNAVLSKALGEKNYKKANEAASNGIFLSFMSYVLFLFIGLFLVVPFYKSQTTDPIILEAGYEYLTIVCCFSIGLFTQFIFERLLQSTGRTILTMVSQALGAIINIILDPILIFGLLGFPALGVRGAAIATVTGQVIAGCVCIFLNHKWNPEIQVSFKGFKPDKAMIATIYKVGVPSIIMQAIGSVMVYGMNAILMVFTATATAVFGVYFKLQSFIFMPVFGLTNAIIPIVAFNYGARDKKRILDTIKWGLVIAISIMAAGTLVFQFGTGMLLNLFSPSEQMIEIGVPALRTISLGFVIAAYCIVVGTLFQALGNGVYSMITSIVRQLVVLLPVAFLLSLTGNLSLVWFAFPIAEVTCLFITTYFLYRINKNIISKIE